MNFKLSFDYHCAQEAQKIPLESHISLIKSCSNRSPISLTENEIQSQAQLSGENKTTRGVEEATASVNEANIAVARVTGEDLVPKPKGEGAEAGEEAEELEQKDIKPDGFGGGAMATLALSGMGGMLGGLMHNGGSPPLGLGHPSHSLTLGHGPASLHAHGHQHAHPHTVLGL